LPSEVWGKADCHIHSLANDGLATPAEIVAYAEEYTDLDVIAITDHDEILGALEAREIVARGHYRLEVIVGAEVTTLEGHLLALGIEKPIRMLLPLERTIAAVHEQGGFVIIPHPLTFFTLGIRQQAINRVLHSRSPGVYIDGLEVFNPSFAGRVGHLKTLELNAAKWHLARCGGSDSHALHTIGSAYTTFPGRTTADFRQALAEKTTDFGGHFWTVTDHTSIAAPQVFRSVIVTPGMRLRKVANWVWSEHIGSHLPPNPSGRGPGGE
jgi:predicted metal-dependent phosphoesterase TrpH